MTDATEVITEEKSGGGLLRKLLPLVLLAVALPICAVWGWFTSVHTGGARWADSLLIAGLVHGSVVTALAVFGWDAVYGVFKVGLRKKNSKGGKA